MAVGSLLDDRLPDALLYACSFVSTTSGGHRREETTSSSRPAPVLHGKQLAVEQVPRQPTTTLDLAPRSTTAPQAAAAENRQLAAQLLLCCEEARRGGKMLLGRPALEACLLGATSLKAAAALEQQGDPSFFPVGQYRA